MMKKKLFKRILPLHFCLLTFLACVNFKANAEEILFLNSGTAELYEFNIPSTQLNLALIKLAMTSNISLVVPYDAIQFEWSKDLVGRYSIEQALAILFEGSDMKAVAFQKEGKPYIVLQVERDALPVKVLADFTMPIDDRLKFNGSNKDFSF